MSLGAEMPRTPDDLVAWAGRLAQADMESVIDKVKEYGAIDLEVMGVALTDMVDKKVMSVTGMEIALTFYLLGKVSRAISAIAKGEPPSADTRKDIRVYGAMLEHVAVFGSWGRFPGNGEQEHLFDADS